MSGKELKILTVYITHNFQNNHLVTTIENEQGNGSSFEVRGAHGTLFFDKSSKCIHKC